MTDRTWQQGPNDAVTSAVNAPCEGTAKERSRHAGRHHLDGRLAQSGVQLTNGATSQDEATTTDHIALKDIPYLARVFVPHRRD